ncbi:MAG: HEAT repeat domain-containing protein [Planctomycetes bacterium]|nr:HEAT repeat domain-containing protein [Planctomycetota bacterium]
MRFRPCQLLLTLSCAAASLGVSQFAQADIFQLKSGGHVTGVIIDRGKQGEYVLQNDHGAVVTLSRRQVKKVVPQDKVDLQYAERSRAMPDTVEAHRELAAWCKENRLTKHVKHHLQRILELDPDDEAARRSLGYQNHRGRWMTRNGIMAARGLQKYDGDFRTPQDIALRKLTEKREQAEADWFRDIRRWVSWLDDRRAEEAAEMIANVKDPYAAKGIIKLLDREKNQRVRDLLTATLAKLKHPDVVTTLVDFSLFDPDQEVRLQCLEYLQQYHQPISLRPFIEALGDRDNVIVNRAAEALQRLEDPRAISPLIDALVTTHKYKNLNAPIGNMGASFSPRGSGPGGGGGGGLNMGGNKNKVIKRNLKNLKVREALVELSGGLDYEYDERLWRRWFVNGQIHDFVDTRRDQ